MRLVLVALVAALAVSDAFGKSTHVSWKSRSARVLQAGPDACLAAMQNVLTCAGPWTGQDENFPPCCEQMQEVLVRCGNGTQIGTLTDIWNRADTELSPVASVVLYRFFFNCPRE
jgi:hypothetical protein